MAQHGFLRRDTAEAITQCAGALGCKRRPHLQETIRETRFEDAAGDGRKGRLLANVEALAADCRPGLLET